MGRRAVGGLIAAFAGLGFAVVAGVGVVSAHIEPDPAAVEAGAAATVGFDVEHGCEGSPTTGVDIQVPASITDAAPVAKDGWTAKVDADVIRFSGGSLEATTPDMFSITFTAPSTPGVINFPIVQTCAVGETDWLDIAVEGQAEPEHPAPAVEVTDGPPTAEDLAVAEDNDDSEGEATETSGVTTTASSESSDDHDSNTGVIVVVVIAAVVVVAGAGVYLLTRRR